ncbi:MAG: monooxygenase [Actinobacteria bacterium]|nr:monooxygenase [Actinomycetota bacterium]
MVRAARVGVVGGSLGGLTAALLLRELGLDVTVYERSGTELQQRGAGIGLLPETYRYLVERADVDVDEISTSTAYVNYLDRDGRVIHELSQPYRFSNWNTIYRSLLRCFGRDRYLLNHDVTDIKQHDGMVQVTLADDNEVEVDLLVCADGIGSRARSRLLPEVTSAYAGYVAWRGVVPEKDLGREGDALRNAITYYVYANSHILVYPIPGLDGSVSPGDRLINFVWYRNYLAGSDLHDLMTDGDGKLHEISLPPGAARPEYVAELRAVAAARLPDLIANVVVSAKEPFVQTILDIEVTRMVFGRVCLIGDAAFAVRPHAAAGTAKAAEDAWELAKALEEQPDIDSALRIWEKGQMELGQELLERTRRIGRRSQVDCNWVAGDPELTFSLYPPGR